MAKVLLNGEIMDEKDAVVPVLDWGVLYGFGLFETMRAYGGMVFRLDAHLNRLYSSAEKISFKIRNSREGISAHIRETLSANNLSDAYVRLTVTYGIGGPRFEFRESEPNVFVIARPPPQDTQRLQKEGVSLGISERYKRDPENPLTYVKSTNYLVNALAKKEALDRGLYDVALINKAGFVAETSTANIFLVKDGVLKTPPLSAGIIPGITRETVLRIAKKGGLTAVESDVKPDELFEADEVFITNATREIAPVVEFDGADVGSGRPGDVTVKLLGAYGRAVLEDAK